MEKIEDMEIRNNHKNQETVKTDKTVKTASAIFSESLKSLKSLMQIFVESAKPIFATSATSASANFAGKASCGSTMRYGVRSWIPSCCLSSASVLHPFRLRLHPLRMVATLLLILFLGVGEVLGADVTYTFSSATNNPGNTNEWYSDDIDAYTNWSATEGDYTPKYYSTGSGLRVYNGGKFSISSAKTISSIKLTFSGTTTTFSSSNTTNPQTVSPNAKSYEWSVDRTCRLQSIEITYAAATAYTVTFYKTDGSTQAITEASVGAGVTPPVMSTPCDGWAFQGWSKSQSTSSTSTTVLTTETLTTGKYYPSANTTLYPVYTKSGGTVFTSYSKVALNGAITTGKYIVSTGTYSKNNTTASGGASFSPSTTANTSYELTITKYSTYFTIQLSGGNYLGAQNGTGIQSTANKASDENYQWTYNSNGIYNSNQERYMRANGTTDFRNYKTNNSYSGSTCAYLYKRNETEITYYYSYPTCCTALGTINGSVSWSGGTSATLTWDAMSNVDATTPYVVTYRTGAAAYGSSNVGSISTNGAGKKTCTITGLTAGTSYDFKIAVSAASGYCDKDSTITSRAPKITTTTDENLVDVTYAEGDGPSTNASYFTFSGVGLTGDVTVTAPTNFLVSKTSSSSGFDGSVTVSPSTGSITNQKIWIRLASGLTNASSPYGGNVALSGGGAATVNVAITGSVSSACTEPTVATPTLTSIASGTITVSCASVTVDENCDASEYGFVWKAGSAPSSTSDGNKVNVGEGTPAGSYSSGLSISFSTGTTYYIKAYAINSAGTTLSSALSVTPQSVTYDSNGGSSVATVYVNNGGTVSKPSDPTRTHYTFDDWYTDNGTWASAVNFSSTITEDKTYYAKWNPVSYTITTSGLTNVAPTSDFPTSFTYTGSTTTDLNRTLAVDVDNFFLPDALSVTMGGSTLTKGTHYSYDNSTGAFTFDVVITGNIVISGSAVAKLKSIAITTTPTKTVYFAGETFSNTGAVVTATMGDKTTKAVSGSAVWTPSGALTAEASKTMTATYTERGISKTATTTVDVYSVTVNKVNEDGDAISADGVTATWTVGSKTLSANVGSTNYVFKEWAFDGDANGLSISSTTSANTTITGTPTGNVTIKAVFYKPVTVTWTVNGESYTTGGPDVSVKRGTQWKNVKLPTAPDDDALESGCDVNKFMGWTNMAEHWVGVTHDDAPTVCLKSFSGVTTVINDPIEFKAVYAKEDVEPGSSTLDITYDSVSSGYASTDFTRKGFTFKRSGDIGGFTCSSYKYIQFKDGKSLYNDTELPGKIKSITTVFYPISSCGSGSDGSGTIYAGSSANPTTNSNSIKTTSDYTTTINYADNTDYTYFAIVATNTLRLVSISVTYADDIVDHSDYITLCSSTNITIGNPSITGEGEITFNQESPVATCLEAQTIIATVTPASGYECTALSFTGGSVNVSPTIAEVLPLTEETEFELSFAKDANGTLATSATFSPKALEGWSWKYKKDADAADGAVEPYDIPSTVEIYKDQYARFIITGYTPSDVIAEKKGYVYNNDSYPKEPQYDRDLLAFVSKNGSAPWEYFQLRGKAATESTTITFKATGDASITKTVTIRVKALPTVTFVDNVHNLTDFTNWGTDGVVSSTVTTGVVSHTKVTPSHDNIDEPAKGNTCEKQHLHLVGWIRSDYDKVADYMDGTTSDKPTESEILGAGTDDGGLEYFLAPNASINIETYNGLTFYAVWALVE